MLADKDGAQTHVSDKLFVISSSCIYFAMISRETRSAIVRHSMEHPPFQDHEGSPQESMPELPVVETRPSQFEDQQAGCPLMENQPEVSGPFLLEILFSHILPLIHPSIVLERGDSSYQMSKLPQNPGPAQNWHHIKVGGPRYKPDNSAAADCNLEWGANFKGVAMTKNTYPRFYFLL